MNLTESKDFLVNSGSLKDVRIFSRDVFEKINLNNELKEELVLAIAEAAQNIVKHAYAGVEDTSDKMQIKISVNNEKLEIEKSIFMGEKKIIDNACITISGNLVNKNKIFNWEIKKNI